MIAAGLRRNHTLFGLHVAGNEAPSVLGACGLFRLALGWSDSFWVKKGTMKVSFLASPIGIEAMVVEYQGLGRLSVIPRSPL